MNFQSEYHTRKSHAQMDCGGKLNASMISADFLGKYKQMKGGNLSNQMIKFYNGYSSLTIPRSIWLHYVRTCDPQSRASFDP